MTSERFSKSLLWLSLAFLVLAMLALSPITCHAQSGAVGAIVIGNALDGLATEIALQNPALSEGNAFLSNSRPQRLILKSASTVLQGWIVYRLEKTGHKRMAKVLGYSAGAALSGIAVRNARMGR